MIDTSNGLDTEIAFALLALAVAVGAWGIAAHLVRRRGRTIMARYRYARRVIAKRGIAHHRPDVEIDPDGDHAVIRWSEEGQERAILLRWHHVLDSEHNEHSSTDPRTAQRVPQTEED